jgi:peptidylprolyl isomerase
MKRTMLYLAPLAAVLTSGATLACGDGPDPPRPTATPTLTAAPAGTAITLSDPTVTESGLQYVDEVVGDGPSPGPTAQVTVNYTGWLQANGFEFDSSAGTPVTFSMDRVIPGFTEALSTMAVGGKRRVIIPSELGYGTAGFAPDIPPNADLVFDIELLAIN